MYSDGLDATKKSGLRPVRAQIRNIRIRVSLFGAQIRYSRIVIWPFSGSQIRYFPDKHNTELQGASAFFKVGRQCWIGILLS
jgi:hypothetical protein